jgi:hypothetical protein
LNSGIYVHHLRPYFTAKTKAAKGNSSESCIDGDDDEDSCLRNHRGLKQKRDEAKMKLDSSQKDFNDCLGEVEKQKVGALTQAAQRNQKEAFERGYAQITDQINANLKEIGNLEKLLQKLSGEKDTSSGSSAATQLQEDFADKMGIPRPPPPAQTGPVTPDFWTSVTLEVSSSYSNESKITDALSYAVDASVSYGLASAAVSVSHNESHSKAVQQMANSNVKISFECMRVDITRPWLRGELFYDHGLRVPSDEQYVFRRTTLLPPCPASV